MVGFLIHWLGVPFSELLKNNSPWSPPWGGPELVVQWMQALSATGRTEFFGRRTLAMIVPEASEQIHKRMTTCKMQSRTPFNLLCPVP